MAASSRCRRKSHHAIRQHVLGRTLRPTNRPLRPPLVSIPASQHEQEGERRETETGNGNVCSRPTLWPDRRSPSRTKLAPTLTTMSEAKASLNPPFSIQWY